MAGREGRTDVMVLRTTEVKLAGLSDGWEI